MPLNPQQQAIIDHPQGPALVIAGAGSGKTRVITERVAKLIASGEDPSSIMVVTFTNKAAAEMVSRIAAAVGQPDVVKRIYGGTFHSLANRFLRHYAKLIGLNNNYSILDDSDARDLFKAAQAELLGKPEKDFPKPNVLQNAFSYTFNRNACGSMIQGIPYVERDFDLELSLASDYPHLQPHKDDIKLVWFAYRARKLRNQALDFDDLLEWWLDLMLQQRPHLKFLRSIRHVLVDEYQDTNRIQADILKALSLEHRNLMVVGDDAQSIYSWRGAQFQNIMRFPEEYQATTYRLEQNYRSTPNILELANACINHNKSQFSKHLFTEHKPLEKPSVHLMYNAEAEAQLIIHKINQLRDEDYSFSDIGILYRGHNQSAHLQMVLTQNDIPYIVRSGVKFFDQAHIKDVVSFLKVLYNPLDEVPWMRILNMVPGIGKTTATKIYNIFREQNAVLLKADNQPLQKAIPSKAREVWNLVQYTFKCIAPEAKTPAEKIDLVYREFYKDYLHKSYTGVNQRESDIQQFQDIASKYRTVGSLLNELSLVGNNLMVERGESNLADEDVLTLSTIHQAKGLEWDAVIVIGLTEGQFPHRRSSDTIEQVEEERRLLYVAMTRARRSLTLTSPMLGSGFNQGNTRPERSRFIRELPQELISVHQTGMNDFSPFDHYDKPTFEF